MDQNRSRTETLSVNIDLRPIDKYFRSTLIPGAVNPLVDLEAISSLLDAVYSKLNQGHAPS